MSIEKQALYYRKRSKVFDRFRVNRNHLNKIKAINNHLLIASNDKVLEIGAGTGIHAKYICDKHNNVEFTGIDISKEMLDKAKQRLYGYKNTSLLVMDGSNLDFPDNYFEKIYISGSLHHIDHPEKVISEMIRCLKKRGRFAIMEPNLIYPKHLFYDILINKEERGMINMRINNFHEWFSNEDTISYKISNFAYTPPFPKQMTPVYDKIDMIFKTIPVLKYFSVMLFITGIKKVKS